MYRAVNSTLIVTKFYQLMARARVEVYFEINAKYKVHFEGKYGIFNINLDCI